MSAGPKLVVFQKNLGIFVKLLNSQMLAYLKTFWVHQNAFLWLALLAGHPLIVAKAAGLLAGQLGGVLRADSRCLAGAHAPSLSTEFVSTQFPPSHSFLSKIELFLVLVAESNLG